MLDAVSLIVDDYVMLIYLMNLCYVNKFSSHSLKLIFMILSHMITPNMSSIKPLSTKIPNIIFYHN